MPFWCLLVEQKVFQLYLLKYMLNFTLIIVINQNWFDEWNWLCVPLIVGRMPNPMLGMYEQCGSISQPVASLLGSSYGVQVFGVDVWIFSPPIWLLCAALNTMCILVHVKVYRCNSKQSFACCLADCTHPFNSQSSNSNKSYKTWRNLGGFQGYILPQISILEGWFSGEKSNQWNVGETWNVYI